MSADGTGRAAQSTIERLAEVVAAALAGPCEVDAGTPLVAACSGGADSVAMVGLLATLGARWPLEAVVFVDHGFRDVAAERRAAQEAADRAAAPFREARVVVSRHGNRQAAARDARYEALEAGASPRAVVATAHTVGDQAETVLQRLLRGSGLRGLAGIRPREGRRVRPLLAIARDDLLALGLPFAEDPTNATDAYLRNRLRHQVLPALRAENPAAESALALVATQAQHELALLDALLDALGPSDPDLQGADPAAAASWVRWRLTRDHPSASVSREAADDLVRRLVAGTPRAAVSLGHDLRGVARDGHLSVETANDPRKVLVAPGPGTYRRSFWVVEVATPATRGHDGITGAPSSDPNEILSFDPASVVWPLTIRLPTRSSGARWEVSDGLGERLVPLARDPEAPPSDDRPALRVIMRRHFVSQMTDRVP